MDLRLQIVQARGLPSMDAVGKSDSYCSARIQGGSTIEHTPVVDNSDCPEWNSSFTLPVNAYGTDILKIQMYDKDVARDDKMGKLTIQVSQLPPGRRVDAWYSLSPTKSCKKPGEIRLVIQIVARGAPIAPDVPFVPLKLRVTIIEAKELANLDTFGKSDPFCVANLVGSPVVWRTTVKDNTLNPHWNETVEFVITNPLFDILHVLVKDKDISADDDMAVLDLPLASLGDLKPKDAWYPLVPVKGVAKGGQIRLGLQLFPARSDSRPSS
jgi:Ca2+-dependent lipid-binding protein